MADPAEGEEVQPQPVAALTEEEIEARRNCFDAILKEFPDCAPNAVKLASRNEREAKELKEEPGLAYGETDLMNMCQILETIKAEVRPLLANETTFLDLGSGAGKLCLGAALLHPFKKIMGVELMDCLGDAADKLKAKFMEVEVPEGVVKPEIDLMRGNFVEEFDSKVEPVAPEVNMCFVAATAFGEKQMQAVEKLAVKMPDNALFITVSRPLPASVIAYDGTKDPAKRRLLATKKALAVRGMDPDTVEVEVPPVPEPVGWMLATRLEVQEVWGPATVFVYEKRAPKPPETDGAAPANPDDLPA